MSRKTFDKCGEAKKFTFVAHVFISLVIALPLMGTVPSAIVQEEGFKKGIQSIWEVWEKGRCKHMDTFKFSFQIKNCHIYRTGYFHPLSNESVNDITSSVREVQTACIS